MEQEKSTKKLTKKEFLAMSLRGLGEATNLDHSQWAGWFAGRNSPSLDTMIVLAEKLNMRLLVFVDAFTTRRKATMESKGLTRKTKSTKKKEAESVAA